MNTGPRPTALYDWHVANHGRMVDFAGWSMPVQYSSIIEEHNATRQAATLFDVSHMGRFEFQGANALEFLDGLTTRRVANAGAGKIRYSLMCNERGTILDDVLVYRCSMANENASCAMVVNASNREKIAGWLQRHLDSPAGEGVTMVDLTAETAMIAVQGPQANDVAAKICGVDPAGLDYYTGVTADIGPTTGLLSRTGYTGEDGCELIFSAAHGQAVWEALLEAGRDQGVRAAGLGARDTLRLEAAMPLYGHELSEAINAAQTGLGFALNFKDRDFVGKSAILAEKGRDDLPCRIGLRLEGKRAAREHSDVYAEGKRVGEVTSGTFSPTLGYPIAMAYVQPHAKDSSALEVDIRGSRHAANPVELPFYSRQKP